MSKNTTSINILRKMIDETRRSISMKKWNIKEINEKIDMYLKEIEMIETRMNNA